MFRFLDRERTVAQPGFNRWLVPPAALSVHLAIGQAYAFSVFNLPMSRLLGITKSAPGDWKLTTLGWIFSLAIVFLGLAASFGGKWVEHAGPRKAMLASACCFGGGFLVAALGVWVHSIIVICLGYGVLGGIGLGLGYVSPVKTLITWFPDHPGMATGMAIMGFGGGAMIGAPLSVSLMGHFKTATSMGVWETFVVLGVVYFVFMMWGVATVRVPPPGWQPEGYTVPAKPQKLVTRLDVSAIHGRLLTSWSAAGLAGPILVNYIREYQIDHGVAAAYSYSFTMYLMAGLLVLAFLTNHLVSEVAHRFHEPALARR